MFGLIPRRKNRENGTLAQTSQSPFELMRQTFDTLFDRFFGPWQGWGLDVEDSGKEIVVRAEAPGFEASDFDVQISGDVLTLRAERKEEGNGKETNRRWARLERSVTLPVGTDPEKVEAHYRNGVLELRLAKAETALPRKIEVKA